MAIFVLVHGAWHGGWCWAGTEAALRALGHEVHTPTLTGLGERKHLLTAEITADTHVLDIVNTLKFRELTGVILVGHSYGGSVITGVAGRVPPWIRALVYLDAFVPEVSGQAIFAKANPKRMAAFQKQINAGAIALAPDAAVDTWSDDPEVKAWLIAQSTPHPKGTFEKGVTLTGREAEVRARHYILADRNPNRVFRAVYDRVSDLPDWTSDTIPTLHDAMVEDPQGLAQRLDTYAATLDSP